MRKPKRFVAPQAELPLIEERCRERLELPPRGDLLRIAGASTGINGVWKVKSAMRFPGGMFLGLEIPELKRSSRAGARPVQEELGFC